MALRYLFALLDSLSAKKGERRKRTAWEADVFGRLEDDANNRRVHWLAFARGVTG